MAPKPLILVYYAASNCLTSAYTRKKINFYIIVKEIAELYFFIISALLTSHYFSSSLNILLSLLLISLR